MNEIINVILRTIFMIILIFFLFKLMGKKQVSQMSMFDYIVGITIGSVVADISNYKRNIFTIYISFTILLAHFLDKALGAPNINLPISSV